MEQVTHADRHILNVCVCPCFICPLEGTVETQIPFFPSSERCPLQIYSAFDFGIAHYNSISNNWRYLYLSHMCVWLSMNDTGCCVARSWGCLCHLPLLSLQDRSSQGRWPVGHHFQGVWQVRQALFCVCVCAQSVNDCMCLVWTINETTTFFLKPHQVSGGHAQASENLQNGACWQPGGLGVGRFPISTFHMGQLPVCR